MKAWKVSVIVGLVTMLAAGTGVVFAQGEDPNPPGDEVRPCENWVPFRPNLDDDEAPRGPLGERALLEGDGGELHELMLSTFADALGMSVEELESQLGSEKGLMGVAIAQGLSEEEAQALFEEARAEALQEAVEQGLIDEVQAQRMLEHEMGPRPGPSMRVSRGDGQRPARRGPLGQDDTD